MIPYIAILAILIVVILYEVYAQSDAFTDASGNRVIVRDASGNPIVASTAPARDASGNPIVVRPTVTSVLAKDVSGNDIKVSLSDLFGLLGPFKMSDASGNTVKAKAPAEVQPTVASTQEVDTRIAKAVAKQVKDELMVQRATEEIYDKYAPCDLTDAGAQGQEFEKMYPRPSRQPDMSEYIRKDSIPCWNCSVP